MAQTGYTPILIYSSTTASQAPSAANLTNSTLGSELAINITDGKLFYKDNGGSVQVIGWKTVPTTAGGTGLTSYTAGDLLYYATGTTLSKLGIGTNGQILKSTGSAPAWETVSNLAVTSISFGTTGLTPSTATQGAVTVAGTLVAANGGTGQSSYTIGDILYASGTTTLSKLADVATGNALISGGVGVAPSWGKIGLTTHVSGTLPTANGGTNLTSFTANGIMYASSSSVLATGSALTFDGTNFATTGTATATKFIPTGSSASGNSIFLPAANSVGISTNGSERVRFDQDGNVGIQTTASAWAWPNGSTGALQLQNYAALSGYNASTYLSNNWYYNAGEKFMANGYATRYEQTSGNHKWYTSNASNAGGAGATVTWVTEMSLDTSGNLTINGATATKASGTTWANPSDERLKTNVQDYTKGLQELMQVRFVTGEYNGLAGTPKGTKFVSVIAQEMQKVLPETVSSFYAKLNEKDEIETEFYKYDSSETQVLVAVSVQQLCKQLEQLKKQFEEYKLTHP